MKKTVFEEPFPTGALPRGVAEMVKVCAKSHSVPESLPGVCALGVLSAAIGRGLAVRSRPPDRVTCGNIYLVVGAPSGVGKTEVARLVAGELWRFESDLITNWRSEQIKRVAEFRRLEKKITKLEGAITRLRNWSERDTVMRKQEDALDAREAVKHGRTLPRVIVEDVTPPELVRILAENHEVVACISTECGTILAPFIRRSGRPDPLAETLYLKAYSGESFRFDRVTRPPVLLDQPCLTALWVAQPDKIKALYGVPALVEDGLLPRIMPAMVDLPMAAGPEELMDLAAFKGFYNLVAVLLEHFHGPLCQSVIDPTAEASALLKAQEETFKAARQGELAEFGPFVARWAEWSWRLAVILHAGKWGEEADAPGVKLDESTARSAMGFADWFAGHEMALLRGRGQHRREDKFAEVLQLLAEKPEGITRVDLYRRRVTATADEAGAILAEMELAGVVAGRDSRPAHGGHVTRRFTQVREQVCADRATRT